MSFALHLDPSFRAQARHQVSYDRGYRTGRAGHRAISMASDHYLAGYIDGRRARSIREMAKTTAVTLGMLFVAGVALYTLMPW